LQIHFIDSIASADVEFDACGDMQAVNCSGDGYW